MKLPIGEIQIKEGRREVNVEHVVELSESIQELGLLNPLTVDKDYTLIAGLHRLEAVKRLGWLEVEVTVSSLEGLKAELAEIDENIIRSDLSALEYGEILLRRKEIYEMLHPETKHGGDRKSEEIKRTKCPFDSVKSFVDDTAEKLKVDPRTVRRQIQTAKNLTPEAKEIIRDSDTKITKKAALKLSRLEPEQQMEAAKMLADGEIRSVDEYHKAAGKASDLPVTAPAAELPVVENPPQEPKPQKEFDEAQGAPAPALPFSLESKPFATFRESIADLKNPDKDCSCTPDIFLAEFTGFIRKFLREIEWYATPHYAAVYPELSRQQLDYLRQQAGSLCDAAQNLIERIERKESL
ncbi:MAG TPA: ParB N-terminal domain-containing protein [Candidatus Eisenbergiella merdigallinarum]|uniref:ParB N-terminal domain-containing protein n=1 Tax=Candidatus Eisenbergiella merdigallinarum TaxID=2838552 RepID=A0A9D2SCB8_9FIRM|nr:ParB N-terminal domain-containing protein [Candidatus Eisenbergiella merdigallinarum]